MGLFDGIKKKAQEMLAPKSKPETPPAAPARNVVEENYQSAKKLAMAIEQVRSRLLTTMKGQNPEHIQAVDRQLEQIEQKLLSQGMDAMQDAERLDKIAAGVIGKLESLLKDSKASDQLEECLGYLREALVTGRYSVQAAEHDIAEKKATAAYLISQIHVEDDSIHLREKNFSEKQQELLALKKEFEQKQTMDLKVRIQSLVNQMKKLKQQLETAKIGLADLQNQLAEVSMHLANPQLMQTDVTDILSDVNQTEKNRMQEAIAHVAQVTQGLTEDAVNIEETQEQLESVSFALTGSAMMDMDDLLADVIEQPQKVNQTEAKQETPAQQQNVTLDADLADEIQELL